MRRLLKIDLPSDFFKAWLVVQGLAFGGRKSVCEAIITCSAWLEGILYKKITEHPTYSKSIEKQIMTFKKRIDYAYKVKIISHHLQKHIHSIRVIRNGFGHFEWYKSGSGMALTTLKKEKVQESVDILLHDYADFLKDHAEIRETYFQQQDFGAIIMIIIAIIYDLEHRNEDRLQKYTVD